MSINNDQHIIRDVMLGLEELVEENPKIIIAIMMRGIKQILRNNMNRQSHFQKK